MNYGAWFDGRVKGTVNHDNNIHLKSPKRYDQVALSTGEHY